MLVLETILLEHLQLGTITLRLGIAHFMEILLGTSTPHEGHRHCTEMWGETGIPHLVRRHHGTIYEVHIM